VAALFNERLHRLSLRQTKPIRFFASAVLHKELFGRKPDKLLGWRSEAHPEPAKSCPPPLFRITGSQYNRHAQLQQDFSFELLRR
jgi:hypothetical protein